MLQARDASPPLFPEEPLCAEISAWAVACDDLAFLGFTPSPEAADLARWCRAGLLVWNGAPATAMDFLEGDDAATACLWKALAARQNVDFETCCNWSDRAGMAPATEAVTLTLNSFLAAGQDHRVWRLREKIASPGFWRPDWLCEYGRLSRTVYADTPLDHWPVPRALLESAQDVEIQSLFEWCRQQLFSL